VRPTAVSVCDLLPCRRFAPPRPGEGGSEEGLGERGLGQGAWGCPKPTYSTALSISGANQRSGHRPRPAQPEFVEPLDHRGMSWEQGSAAARSTSALAKRSATRSPAPEWRPSIEPGAVCARPPSPSRRGPPASRSKESSRRSREQPAASARRPLAAWVYCAIMCPESTPGSSARNGVQPVDCAPCPGNGPYAARRRWPDRRRRSPGSPST
jgi:hypothetical protein